MLDNIVKGPDVPEVVGPPGSDSLPESELEPTAPEIVVEDFLEDLLSGEGKFDEGSVFGEDSLDEHLFDTEGLIDSDGSTETCIRITGDDARVDIDEEEVILDGDVQLARDGSDVMVLAGDIALALGPGAITLEAVDSRCPVCGAASRVTDEEIDRRCPACGITP